MAPKVLEKREKKAEQTECVHHWVIDPPDGPISMGYCQKCGKVEEFPNHFAYSTWDNTSSTLKELGIDIDLEPAKEWD